MTLFQYFVLVVICSLMTDVLSQTLVVTYLQDTNQPLECIFTESALTVTWTYEDTSPSTSLATYVVGDQNLVVENDSGKYENFEYSVNGLNFILAITNVEESDGGMYRCTQTTGGVRAVYDVMVEVPPEDVTVSCFSCTKEDSSCNCHCSASAGSSPSILTLEWKINDVVLSSQSPTANTTHGGQIVYSSNAVVPVSKDDSVVTCTVTGFENQGEIAPLFPNRIEAELTLSSPDCTVSVSDDNCPASVELSCECNGYPSVQEPYTYYSRSESEDTGTDKLLSSPSYNVNLDEDSETYFVCMGENGLNFPQKSEAVINPCQKGTSTVQTKTYQSSAGKETTTVQTKPTQTGPGKDCPSCSAFVAICCVEAVIIVMMFVTGFLHLRRKGWRKEEVQSLVLQPNAKADNTNPAYMDLQATKQTSSSSVNIDVAFENLNLKEPLPGKGFLIYQKAQMILTTKREDIVVKTVSDDAPAKLAKLQADEVRMLSKLTSNANVIPFLGRCNNVPNLLCYEFVNGTKFGHYLRENFQRSKLHQYGNTKQKRYHVAEKGSVENLPRNALQIARGMKYLTAQKFLHPGLRSEKVIIDASGQCKLYDFVSNDNAKEIISILWGKFVPYQWMPPEYLFFEKLDPGVDVWSFGVLLWETFSYGALPHEGKSRSDVEKRLREKEYLPMPNNCPGAIWQMILNCWEQSPEKRPSFDHLFLQLSLMCNDNKEYDEIKTT